MSRREAAHQRDKARPEQCSTHCRAFGKRPSTNDIAPQERKDDKITPDHELEVVPFPWRGFQKITDRENYNRRHHKGDVRRRFIAPSPASFPNTPADQAD